ncbi:MAG TPA: hypothetical protein VFG43_08455, partial [Geminicoccaceae bacterium]|nr:hypothetical protein [Geminicoccaceae bacterium]
MSPRPRCYVSIPFGRKRAADGELVDFDAVYREVIRPGVEEAGVECVRGDDLVSGEPIHAAVLRAVLGSEVVIADLTTRNPNVLYELGIRHGLVPSGTILLLAENEMLPFNLNMLWTLRYPLFEGMVPEDRRPHVQGLVRDAVIRCIEQRSEDSPVYYFFPHLRAELRELHLSPATAGGLRARPILRREERRPDQRELLEQLHRAHSGGSVAAFYGRHRATLRELGASDLETAIEIAKVLRLADAWDELLDFIAGLPGALRESRTLVHEHAMALSRRGRGDDLDQAVAAVTAL